MFQKVVVFLVRLLAVVAGVAAMAMITVTCLDVILRQLGHPLLGVVDIVQITAWVAGICALPYTTATKGHVAVEFFFQRLPGDRSDILYMSPGSYLRHYSAVEPVLRDLGSHDIADEFPAVSHYCGRGLVT